MADKLDKIESKIDKLIECNSDIKVNIVKIQKDLEKNTEDLERNAEDICIHIKRTNLLEERLDKLEEPNIAKKYIYKTLISFGALCGVVLGILKITSLFLG